MYKVFIITSIILSGVSSVFGTNIIPSDDSIVKIDKSKDKVLIEFLRDSDVLTKRPILIYDEEGNQIFKSRAKKFEKITEINMTNVKVGDYIIKMVLEDKSVDIQFTKS